MSEQDLLNLMSRKGVAPWRQSLARWVESKAMQAFIIGVILLNGLILGMETSDALMDSIGGVLLLLDKLCLIVFILEIGLKLVAYRLHFWRSGWNWFDFLVVGIALAPGAGPWSVLRSLRILRVLRLLTVMPQLRKVVAAFVHAIPGLSGVMVIMAVFFYTMGVLATNLFGAAFPQWFGSLGASLFSLFQIMTLESWSMGIVRPVMEVFPWAWTFFVPFIVIATFTILNLFIGIIVSTMQELQSLPDPNAPVTDLKKTLTRMEEDLAALRAHVDHKD
ncbi:MAG: voltage-gated sodium channel [Candidatus Azotimanducaceae bacterium]|jgi:voltage-gated sodium channel